MSKIPSSLYALMSDGFSVQCLICNHFCKILPNNLGKCKTKLNIKGSLHSAVYGYPISINLDPVEKKPLHHFYPSTRTLSIGTLGCNFNCLNCQNHEISQCQDAYHYQKQLQYYSPESLIQYALAKRIPSISYTYTEPTIYVEYALDVMKLAKSKGIKNIWVSNGFMSLKTTQLILPYTDAANIDLKSSDPKFYKDVCESNLYPVLENLKVMSKNNVHVEVTTLIIPTLSDNMGMLSKVAKFIGEEMSPETVWHVSAFSPEISWKLKHLPHTSPKLIEEVCKMGKNSGLKYVYSGNVISSKYNHTYCAKCKALGIERIGYQVVRKDKKGYCKNCGESLHIIE